jgi:hypothetical protein
MVRANSVAVDLTVRVVLPVAMVVAGSTHGPLLADGSSVTWTELVVDVAGGGGRQPVVAAAAAARTPRNTSARTVAAERSTHLLAGTAGGVCPASSLDIGGSRAQRVVHSVASG